MLNSELQLLPLGRSGFPALRASNSVYVDKTAFIYQLAREDGKFFLARPRRFGKSLLVSTLESLFKFGLRDFDGLAISKLWTDTTYSVAHLDFSLISTFKSAEDFSKKFQESIADSFAELGFAPTDRTNVLSELSGWLKKLPSRSLVILIDEYDAPLTACLDTPKLFEAVLMSMREFYLTIKSCDDCLRFLFMTGITKFSSTSIFSELNNVTDLTLNSDYGSLLGYTKEEIQHYFAAHIAQAAEKLHLSKAEILRQLEINYDGFCFDRQAASHVFCPWSVLSFLAAPTQGFNNYWYASGGKPSVLMKYLVNHSLADPASYAQNQEVSLSDLSNASDLDTIDIRVLLTQAGYLTIKAVASDGWIQLGYPNKEVSVSMAQLYSRELFHGKRIKKPDAPTLEQVLAEGALSDVVDYFNWIFNSIDYQNYPVTSESHCRALLLVLLIGAGLPAISEKHSALGRSDLEVDAGHRRWVFEIKYAKVESEAPKLLKTAVEQMQTKRYGDAPHGKDLIRVALVFGAEDRRFIAWQQLSA